LWWYRFFYFRFGIYCNTGCSRVDSELSVITNYVASTRDSKGFTAGAKVGFQFNFSQVLATRFGYGFVSDVIDSGSSLQLDGYNLGLRFEC